MHSTSTGPRTRLVSLHLQLTWMCQLLEYCLYIAIICTKNAGVLGYHAAFSVVDGVMSLWSSCLPVWCNTYVDTVGNQVYRHSLSGSRWEPDSETINFQKVVGVGPERSTNTKELIIIMIKFFSPFFWVSDSSLSSVVKGLRIESSVALSCAQASNPTSRN